ncbi:MAG: hypothetical protein LBC59_03400 [Chitinispirillales bacterium]|nr:hypothetical protein [Chitinispirillales bacterium]
MISKSKPRLITVLVAVVISFSTVSAQGGGIAQIPVIVTHPQSVTLWENEWDTLFVDAVSSDGGTLTYQWYRSLTEDNSETTILWSNATERTFPVGWGTDTLYFFALVTNTTQEGSASVKSNVARVASRGVSSPYITANPQNASVGIGEEVTLSVSASLIGDGRLSYQWLRNTNLNDRWEGIDGATNSSYVPDVSKAGTLYYRVLVTNTNDEHTASSTSYAATVTVADAGKVNAKFPIVSGPNSVEIWTFGDPTVLSVEAESPDGGTLSYQWYKTPYTAYNEINIAGIAIDGATEATFDPGLESAGSIMQSPTLFYVEVTNTNTQVNGEPTAVTRSRMAHLSMPLSVPPAINAIQTYDRVIPHTDTNTGTATIAPAGHFTAEFTAGPNPVVRNRGAIAFFHQGKRIKEAALVIYDASGNFVKKVAVSDKTASEQSRRRIGSWDLTDKKGRSVPAGTYLARGVLKTPDGKRVKVSAVFGVQ